MKSKTSYTYSEPFNTEVNEESEFYICDTISDRALLYRVLSGTCLIENNNSEVTILSNVNYFVNENAEIEIASMIFLDEFQENLKLEDYEKSFKSKKYVHRNFYKHLLNEVTGAVYNFKNQSYTASFVHIYRAYEFISYAFPMIYSSKTNDFLSTFNKLRAWLNKNPNESEKSELGFQKSALNTIFDENYKSLHLDVHINVKTEYRERVFKAMTEKVLEWKSSSAYSRTTVSPEKISIPLMKFHDFIITMRNRFFHFSHFRPDNLEHDDILDTDTIFSIVTPAGIRYLAILTDIISTHEN